MRSCASLVNGRGCPPAGGTPGWRRGFGAVLALAACIASAQAEERPYLADPGERQAAYRETLRAGTGETGALVAAAVGIAAAGCEAGGPLDEARQLIAGLADSLPADAGTPAVEVQVAIAACALVAGDRESARAALRAAADAARAAPDAEDRDSLLAWVADAAASAGALQAEIIMEWATEIGRPRARASAVRAWALAGFVGHARAPIEIAPAGPYAALEVDQEKLQVLAAGALDAGDMLGALRLAAAIPTSAVDARGEVLETVFSAARDDGDYALARIAAMAVSDPGDHADRLAELAQAALDDGRPADAATTAALMPPSRDGVNAWLDVAAQYDDSGYPQMTTAALEAAEGLARRAAAPDQSDLLSRVAGRSAQLDDVARAIAILDSVEPGADWPKAVADLAKRLAEVDRLPEAIEWAGQIDQAGVDPEVRGRAFGTIAKALAEAGDVEGAIETLESRADLAGRYVDRGLRAIAVALARNGDADRAAEYLGRIQDAEERSRAETELARATPDEESALDRFRRSVELAAQVEDAAARDRLLAGIAEEMIARGLPSAVAMVEPGLTASATRDLVRGLRLAAVADPMMDAAQFDGVVAALDGLDDGGAASAARAAFALRLSEADQIRRATAVTRGIDDYSLRLATFRRIAERQAARLDAHGAIATAPEEAELLRLGTADPAAVTPGGSPLVDRAGLAAYSLGGSEYGRWAELVGLSGRLAPLRFTPDDVRAGFPAPGGPARVHRLSSLSMSLSEKFMSLEPIIDHSTAQREVVPNAIYIERGVVTLSMVRERLLHQGMGDYLTVEHGVYLLRRPLIVGPEATLVITAADARELRLSTRHRAYLITAGDVYIADVAITSWDVTTGSPSEIESDYAFRPFILGWSGSSITATRAQFRALGYNNRKAFGFSLSAGPHDFLHYGIDAESPRGLLVENLFDRMFYGFYTAEVFGADLVGNEYRNNVIYGPDPHDYSEDILMAYNTAYGTGAKHGFIVSREVDAIFVGNIAFDNQGAGIMLDRLSNHSIIYANTVFDNEKDGISVYETACVIVANNLTFDNALTGVRVRNSTDVGIFDNDIARNRDGGIALYADNLLTHTWRDVESDPFWTTVTSTIADNRLVANRNAVRTLDAYAVTMADNAFIENGDRAFVGDFDPIMSGLMRHSNFAEDSLLLTNQCRGHRERHSACGFRDLGVFAGDGQDQWSFEDGADVCEGNYRLTNVGLMREAAP